MEKTKKPTANAGDVVQSEIKRILKLEYLNRAKLDAYSSNLYLLKDLYVNSRSKKDGIRHLGYERPEDIPFFPEGFSYRAATSGSKYNEELLVLQETMVEYDFSEAYTNIMRTYALPSNTYLPSVSFDKEKLVQRFDAYNKMKHPYRDMKTFLFFKIKISAIGYDETYTEWGSAFQDYTKYLQDEITISEIELKLIFDHYAIIELEVLETYGFRCRKGLLNEYFERLDPLKQSPDKEIGDLYKGMRNKLYGTIGKRELSQHESRILDLPDYYLEEKGIDRATLRNEQSITPIFNRAFSSAVAGIFRDRIARLEQKYVKSEYGLVLIRTDGLYFRKEVPEFEKWVAAGIVKKKVHTITDDYIKN